MTAHGWAADGTQIGYLGATAHWIHVNTKTSEWTLQSETVGFRSIFGMHTGKNLGRYLVAICDRIGILSRTHSKVSNRFNFLALYLTMNDFNQLFTVTLDNISNNQTLCQEVESQHVLRVLPEWDAEQNQIPCLEHAVQLSVASVMDHVTKRAIAESSTAIWEYDPSLEENKVAGGKLDVLSVLRTINIKVRASLLIYSYYDTYSASI